MENNVNNESITYFKRTLHNYFYLKKMEMYYRREVFELEDKINDEIEVSGISYSSIVNGNGCSSNYPVDSYVNQLIKEQAGYDQEADRYMRLHKSLDKQNSINKRIKQLTSIQQKLIYAVFKDNRSYADIAKELYGGRPSKQTVNGYVNDVIECLIRK